MPITPRSQKGIAHIYSPALVAFEHAPATGEASPDNILILVGGLGDGLLTVPFFSTLATGIPPNWSLAQALISSSYSGWGTGSVAEDATDLAACVAYFRGIKSGKIVIMGHSTGSQDVMEYLTGPGQEFRLPVDGSILQAPVSDRDAMLMTLGKGLYDKRVAEAQHMVDIGRGEEILPPNGETSLFGSLVCARRWLSLASPNHDGEDDYFSSGLTDQQLAKTFGKLPARTPMCILYMGGDEFVPPSLDKKALVNRWIGIAEAGGANINKVYSGVVEGCSHNMRKDSDEVVREFMAKVHGFLESLSPHTSL